MKKCLLYISLGGLLFAVVSCKPHQPVNTGGTTSAGQLDTQQEIPLPKRDTLVLDTVKTDKYEGHQEAPDHKGPNQAELDSIKREKQKTKK